MSTDQTILLAIDLNDSTLIRLERSYLNLKYLTQDVVLLYVLESLHHISNEVDKTKMVSEKDLELKKLAEEIHQKTGLGVRPVIQSGKAYEEILKAADSYNAGMIIMSTHTHPEDDHTMKHTMGVTTNRVVRASKIPVFTFNSNVHLKPINKILLPLDLTVETKQKVTNAIDLALRFDASIDIVSVYWSTRIDDIKQDLQQQLDQVKSFIEEDGIQCNAKLIESEGGARDLAASILKYADSVDADLIMIMTQQETKLVEFFMGSAAQTLIRYSNTPVMSIKPKELSL